MNITEQIADIRERTARIEATLEHLRCSQKEGTPAKGGIYIPVALMTVLVQGCFVLAQHLI